MSLKKLSEAIGPKVTVDGALPPNALWVEVAKPEEIDRYLVLDGRTERRKLAMKHDEDEKFKIARRCIRRRARMQGKK